MYPFSTEVASHTVFFSPTVYFVTKPLWFISLPVTVYFVTVSTLHNCSKNKREAVCSLVACWARSAVQGPQVAGRIPCCTPGSVCSLGAVLYGPRGSLWAWKFGCRRTPVNSASHQISGALQASFEHLVEGLEMTRATHFHCCSSSISVTVKQTHSYSYIPQLVVVKLIFKE